MTLESFKCFRRTVTGRGKTIRTKPDPCKESREGELMKNPVIRKIPCPAKKKSF